MLFKEFIFLRAMLYYIDQAGKIECTCDDTVLALWSDEIQYSIKISKKIKQNIFNACKKSYRKKLMLRLFAYSLHLLIQDKTPKSSIIVIDDEYPGHGKDIIQHLEQYSGLKRTIRIDLIGKKNHAHRIANQTFSGKLKPNQHIKEEQVDLTKLIPNKKLKEYLK